MWYNSVLQCAMALCLISLTTSTPSHSSINRIPFRDIRKFKPLNPYSRGPALNCTQWKNDRDEMRKQKTIETKDSLPENEEDPDPVLNWLFDSYDDTHPEDAVESKSYCDDIPNMFQAPDGLQDEFDKSPDHQIIACSKNTDSMIYLKPCQLNYILTNEKIIESLESKTILGLLENDTFVEMIRKDIPFTTMAKLVQIRPEIVTKLRQDYPAARYISDLMKNVHFLKRLPKEFIGEIMESQQFRHLIDEDMVRTVLKVHPRIPLYLSKEAFHASSIFFLRQDFVSDIDCNVFVNVVKDVSIIERLSPQLIESFSKNKHFWNCLPAEELNQLMKSSIGSKLNLRQVYNALFNIRTDALLNTKVLKTAYDMQMLQVLYRAESDTHDWMNHMKDAIDNGEWKTFWHHFTGYGKAKDRK